MEIVRIRDRERELYIEHDGKEVIDYWGDLALWDSISHYFEEEINIISGYETNLMFVTTQKTLRKGDKLYITAVLTELQRKGYEIQVISS